MQCMQPADAFLIYTGKSSVGGGGGDDDSKNRSGAYIALVKLNTLSLAD